MSSSTYGGLSSRVAVVTGADGGLGRAVVRRFLEHGTFVIATDLVPPDIEAFGCPGDVPGLRTVALDLADPMAAEHLVAEAVQTFGRLDILVNNAAILRRQPLEEVSIEDFDRAIAVNLRAPFFLSRAAMEHMRAQRWGRVINISSVGVRTGGSSGSINDLPYLASKGGLVSLTKALARAGAADNVLASAVLPAAIHTPMVEHGYQKEAIEHIKREIPLGRLSQPQEIAELVLWLSSDAASYVTGASFDINGGWVMT